MTSAELFEMYNEGDIDAETLLYLVHLVRDE